MRYYDVEEPEGQAWDGWDSEVGEGSPGILEPVGEDVEPFE